MEQHVSAAAEARLVKASTGLAAIGVHLFFFERSGFPALIYNKKNVADNCYTREERYHLQPRLRRFEIRGGSTGYARYARAYPAILPIRIQVRKKNSCIFNRERPPPTFGFPHANSRSSPAPMTC
jgi:hypothetical protein